MANTLREMVADAERLAAPFADAPVHMRFCSVHPNREYERNWAGLLVCPDQSHQPDRGDEE
jgi:hypothetical protein